MAPRGPAAQLRAEEMVADPLRFERKFFREFGRHSEARARYFERIHGDGWKREMARVNREFSERFLPTLNLGKAECKRLRTEMEIRLSSPWSYIQANLEYAAKQGRGEVSFCGDWKRWQRIQNTKCLSVPRIQT